MKKALKIFGILLLILILFKGWIYRHTIHYNDIGNRQAIRITNQTLIDKIEAQSNNKKIGIYEIIHIANSITKSQLSFTNGPASNNPNELINTNRANCIGYSAMFNSIANYLISKNNLANQITANHKIGKLDLWGIDLHQFFERAFFQNHDFNEVKHKDTNEIIFIDPTINDYLKITSVSAN